MSELNCLLPILVPSVLWGITPIFYTIAIKQISYMNVFIFAYIFSFIIVSLFAIINRKKIILINSKNNKGFLALFTGAFLSLVATYYFYKSIKKCKKSYKVVAITYSLPIILSTIFCIIILKEKISIKNIFGIILALIGINFIYY